MRLLLLNGNTTEAITRNCEAAARAHASPGTEIVAASAPFGARVIGTRAENAIAQHAMLEAAAGNLPGCDGVVLAVSYDTALDALRELLPVPVVGMTEAAMLTACMLGGRFGIATLGTRAIPVYRELVERHGLERRLAGIAAHDAPAAAYTEPALLADDVAALCASLATDRAADAVVLAGAALAGLRPALQARTPVPLLDGIACAVAQAETLVRLGLPKPHVGSYAPVPARETTGLSDALARLLRPGMPTGDR